MDFTPRLHLPYIAPQQAQKQVTYNAAMRALDLLVQPAVKSRSLSAAPGDAAPGNSYIVAAGASGSWAGKEQQVATLLDGGWSFRDAANGWTAYVEDAAELAVFEAGSWRTFASTGGSMLARFGINATADLTNRLVLASEASLFTHDGSDHRLKLNKALVSDTASLLLQTGFSGRVEMGLAGDDDFHLKVSADGAGWLEALTVAGSTGLVRLPQGQLAFPAIPNPSGEPRVLDDYEEGGWTPGLAFGGTATGIIYDVATAGSFTKIGRLCTASGTLALASKGAASGVAVITGLPFVSAGANVSAACAVGEVSGCTVAGVLGAQQVSGSDGIALLGVAAGTTAALTDAAFSDASLIRFTVSYETS
jgi:hypothetical protein